MKKQKKLSFKEWLETLDDKMHHVGEYFIYLTGKKFDLRSGYPSKPFLEWYKENEDKLAKVDLSGFNVYRSRFIGFLFERKKLPLSYPKWVDEEFEVQCFHCKGKKGRTIKKKGKTWAFCPNCGAGLDIMNKVPAGTIRFTLKPRKVMSVRQVRDLAKTIGLLGENHEGYWRYYTVFVALEKYDNGEFTREQLLKLTEEILEDPDKEEYKEWRKK